MTTNDTTQTADTAAADQALDALLKDYPMQDATPEFFDKAVLVAARKGAQRQRNRWLLTGFGGAIAAGIVAWLIGGMMLTTPDSVAPEIPGVAIAIEQRQQIDLVFASSRQLNGAILTVELPEGVELAGFPGQRSVSWETALDAGRNHLPLTLIATQAVDDAIVVARLEHENRSKTFELRIDAS